MKKKKLLFIPLDFQYNPHQDWYNAFKEHYDCLYYTDLDKAVEFKPDYVFAQCSAIPFFDLHLLRYKTNCFIIQWTGDARDEIMENVTNFKILAKLTLLATGIGQKDMYEKALWHPVDYLQQGAFESFFIAPKELENGKTIFIGNNYNQFEGAVERTNLCRILCDQMGNDFEVIGSGYVGYNNTRTIKYGDSAKEYNEAYISISHACFNEIDGYYSNRTLDIMASGGCCLMRYTKGAEKFFEDMVHCVFYRSNEEALEKIKLLYKVPQLRNKIAVNGQELVFKNHRYNSRVNEINNYIKKYEI